MKKLLVITYYFPPQTSVGTYRPQRFVEHLHDFGFAPMVLTVRNPDQRFHPGAARLAQQARHAGVPVLRVKEIPIKWLWVLPTVATQRFLRLVGVDYRRMDIASLFWLVDMQYGWVLPAFAAARKLIRKHQIDTVFLTCPPFSLGVVGLLLRLVFGRRLRIVADFRDGWTGASYGWRRRRLSWRLLERGVVRAADHLTVTSPADALYYQPLVGAKKISVIYNGVDELGLTASTTSPPAPFRIIHFGEWGAFGRDPRPLLTALRAQSFTWELISIGEANELVAATAMDLGVTAQVRCVGHVPKTQLGGWIASATVVFVIKGDPPNGALDSSVAAKCMDCIASGKPVLAEVPPGATKDFLSTYSDRAFFVSAKDLGRYVQVIADLQARWQGGELQHAAPNQWFIEAFSASRLTAQLVAALRRPKELSHDLIPVDQFGVVGSGLRPGDRLGSSSSSNG